MYDVIHGIIVILDHQNIGVSMFSEHIMQTTSLKSESDRTRTVEMPL